MQIEPATGLGEDRSHDGTTGSREGGSAYPLRMPLPVPGKLSWGVTAYDAHTRSELEKRTLGSLLYDPKDVAPEADERQWTDTIPGGGLILYLRLHGSGDSQRSGRSDANDRSD
jgi:hypothetical protein